MGKSFRAYIAAFGKWGFFVAALLVGDILGIIQVYEPNITLPPGVWWIILVVVLLVSPFIAFHKMRLKRDESQKELDDIKNMKPVIGVNPIIHNNSAYLRIQNRGGYAKVTARAKVVGGFIKTELYDMCWEAARQMNNNDESLILVGEVIQGALVLYKMTDYEKDKFAVSNPEKIQDSQLKERYPTMHKGKRIAKDECVIEVIITSEPSSIKAPQKYQYSIGIDYEQDYKLFFMPLPESVLDEKGSLSK